MIEWAFCTRSCERVDVDMDVNCCSVVVVVDVDVGVGVVGVLGVLESTMAPIMMIIY